MLNAFGIYPRDITLAPGELKEFQAYVVWSDGTTEDISRRPRSAGPREGSFAPIRKAYYLTVKATLDMEREDTATIYVKAPLEIRGPASAKVGDEVTAKAILSSPKAGVKHRYSWSLNGQTLAGNDDTKLPSSPRGKQHAASRGLEIVR